MPAGATPEAIDRFFADFIRRIDGRQSPLVWAAAWLVSRATREGHTCIDLLDPATQALAQALTDGVGAAGWVETLAGSRVVGTPQEKTPLVLDARRRLFLRRYWEYEQRLARALTARAHRTTDPDILRLEEGLKRLFPPPDGGTDWQALSARVALTRSLCVISGGPGTGKTSTVVKILALLLEHYPALRVALCAPTGKAADRLQSAVAASAARLPVAEGVRGRIPREAQTLHRLLGFIPGRTTFRHNALRRLPHDVVVVDEASMVDLALMTRLLDALREDCRLIILGDRDQLSSVEAGSVFGDICDAARGHVPEDPDSPGLGGCMVELRHTWRFGDKGGIGRLSAAVRDADAASLWSVLQAGAGEVTARELPRDLAGALAPLVCETWRPFFRANREEEYLAILERRCILSPVHKGPCGVENLNALIRHILAGEGLVEAEGLHYHGRPIMITANAYDLGLFNGDVGLILKDEDTGELRAVFAVPGGPLRRISPARLPEHETVYAMSVHKSQGSEFDEVLLVLPQADTPVLTRELVYTGITRARKRVELWGAPAALERALNRSARRASGLRDALADA